MTMKTKMIAAMLVAGLGLAACADTSTDPMNSGLTKDVTRSNVPAVSGSVPGFHVANVGFFVAEASAEHTTVAATVVPGSVDVKDQSEVQDYLNGLGYTNIRFVIDSSTEGCTVNGSRDPDSNGCFVDDMAAGTVGESGIGRVGIPAYQQRW